MLIYDLAEPQELLGYVREFQLELERNRFWLSQFLPNDMIDEVEFRVTQGEFRDQDASQFRAWDTESPIGSRQGVRRLLGELPPTSKKIRLGEEERLRRRALERRSNTELINAIYADAQNMARSVLARIELARGEALHTGQLQINENGVQQTVNFNRHSDMTVTANTLWSNHADANPVQDVRTWVEAYLDHNDTAPAVALTSTKVISHLLFNSEIRTLAGSLAGAPNLVTQQTAQSVFQAHGLPPFVAYDTKVRVDGNQAMVLPENKVIFLPPSGEPLGATFFGTTAEALELADAQQIEQAQAPGLVAVVQKTFDPVATWTKAAAVGLPVLANPDLSMVATVA